MAHKVQKPCKVCGKLYTPCGDCERDNIAFHWRTVACSYECGQIYLAKVMAAREVGNENLYIEESTEIIKEAKQKKRTYKAESNEGSEQIE